MNTIAAVAVAAAAAVLAGCGGPTFDVGTPFAVVATVPDESAVVELNVEPKITFNRAVDRASFLLDGNLTLTAAGDDVELNLRFSDGDEVVRVSPVNFLPENVDVVLALAAKVGSADGVELSGPVDVTFHTIANVGGSAHRYGGPGGRVGAGVDP